MEITYLGHSAFKISGKEVNIICDPFDPARVGLKLPKLDADIVTISHDHKDHNYLSGVRSGFVCFDSPGEYEIKNSEIVGIDSYHDDKNGQERGQNTIFSFEVDQINICHLGDLGQNLSSDQLEKINGVDVLMIPVGGIYTIDAKLATKIISEIEPKIVIPMHFRAGSMKELEPLDTFLKEIGVEPRIVERLKVVKKDLPEKMEVIVFQG